MVPPLISQGTHLIEIAPSLLESLKNNATIANFNDHYGVIDTLQKKLSSVTSDGTLLITAFGGVIGVGKSVLSGTFTALTIIVLTLYFITSLPQATELGLKLVPASRRTRVAAPRDAALRPGHGPAVHSAPQRLPDLGTLRRVEVACTAAAVMVPTSFGFVG